MWRVVEWQKLPHKVLLKILLILNLLQLRQDTQKHASIGHYSILLLGSTHALDTQRNQDEKHASRAV